jgi:Zn finger protein HypA/HybF involved in hydrogenase expression
VRTEDEEQARAILSEIHNYSLDDEGNRVICPICNSSRVKVYTHIKDVRSFFAFLFSFLTFALPIHYKYDYHCENCEQKFILK